MMAGVEWTHAIPSLPPADFTSPSAAERRTALERRFPDRVQVLIEACRRAPNPDLALSGVDRFADVTGTLPAEDDLLQALALLCGASRMIAALLARWPHLLRRCARSPYLARPKPAPQLERLLARAASRLEPNDVEGLLRLLRKVRASEMIRIALRDLRRARVSEVTAELTALAVACVETAIQFHDRRLRAKHGPPAGMADRDAGAGFCALAMGKLGSRELNFSSDIDVIFVYGVDGNTEGERPITHFAYYAKLAELVTEAIAKPTEDGFVFRVDLNLRPDGHSGPIVNSVRAAELYYQSFGRSWERNALIKARSAAGDLAVGEELLHLLEPFVWRKSLDLDVVSEIHAMKARIDARAGAERKEDLKLGTGGIREVEFFASALQLLHGGRRAELRTRGMIETLDRLVFAGLVPVRDRDVLADAYLFLRRAEHRVQMVDGQQTHRLPAPADRIFLARAMGYAQLERFEEVLDGHRQKVSELFADLLGGGTLSTPLDPELALLADQDVEVPRRTEIALRRGLADPDRAIASLDALARRRTPFSRHGDPEAAVALLTEALATPDPDQALSHLSDFAAALEDSEPYFKLLSERRQAARLLISLFGTSDFLSKRFLRYPELLDALLREDLVVLTKSRAQLEQEMRERLRLDGPEGTADFSDDELERLLGELRRYKNEEVLRIAMHDIAGSLKLVQVSQQLSDLAEVCLEQALALAEVEARVKGRSPPGRLCVVAMGKLGGRELGYHSDLDLIFLYREGSGQDHGVYSRLAQRLMSFLQMPLREGFLYKIDTRLRPSGNKGALVTSAEGFTRYHTGLVSPAGQPSEPAVPADGSNPQIRSQLWERQALLRARFAAGDARIFAEVSERIIQPVVYGRPSDRATLAEEIRRMRVRMQTELGQESTRGLNPKTGHGGLVDIEFAAQFLQLAHGHAHPPIRTPSTPEALARLRERGLLGQPAFEALWRGYEFLRRLELRLRIVHDYTIDHLPTEGRPLAQLARRLGYFGEDPGARLLADYGRITESVRLTYDEVVR
jgi:glutamate-ammonia-ligase adenylyltransferase